MTAVDLAGALTEISGSMPQVHQFFTNDTNPYTHAPDFEKISKFRYWLKDGRELIESFVDAKMKG